MEVVMSSPDTHTNTLLDEGYDVDVALRFHLSSRVFPYWSQEHITAALPALRTAIQLAREGLWDVKTFWTYPGDGTRGEVTARELFEGLNLWGFEGSEEEE
jgi:hypothetical protein